MTSIERHAFTDCGSLEIIIIPVSVITIAENAFDNEDLIIYCEASSKPEGWSEDWVINSTVIWGYVDPSKDNI